VTALAQVQGGEALAGTRTGGGLLDLVLLGRRSLLDNLFHNGLDLGGGLIDRGVLGGHCGLGLRGLGGLLLGLVAHAEEVSSGSDGRGL
jgi:hypothetical protein